MKTQQYVLGKVWPKVIEDGELESDVSFLKFFSSPFFYTKDHFFYKKIVFL
jgi:hypothetical protein